LGQQRKGKTKYTVEAGGSGGRGTYYRASKLGKYEGEKKLSTHPKKKTERRVQGVHGRVANVSPFCTKYT